MIKLIPNKKRICECGKVGGKYIDNLNAIYFGKPAVPIGFNNTTLVNAVHKQPKSGMGSDFSAFVIPKDCKTFKLVSEKDC